MAARHILLAVVLSVWSNVAGAQDRVTLFLHGYDSNALTWWDTAGRLQARLELTPAALDLPWTRTFDDQANYINGLANAYGAPGNMAVVGHSNGGLVARQLSTKRPLGGIVTLGSPHQGAPLVRNAWGAAYFYARTGEDLGLLLYMLGAVNGTNQYTGIWFSPGLAPLRKAISVLGVVLAGTADALFNKFVATYGTPVVTDMAPGSAALSSLNSGGNLARESAAVPARVGLVYAARDWGVGAPLVAVNPGLQYWADGGVKTGVAFLSYIWSYFSPPNVLPTDAVARSIRLQTERLISDLFLFNSVWCAATTNVPDCSVSTDGVVPTTSQFFPGDARNFGFYGPAHVTETERSENYVHDALVGVVGLRTRGGGGTGGGTGGGGGGGGAPASTLTAGERLYPDTEIRSPNNQYALRYQSDGNLVIYGPSGAVWDSGTSGRGASYVEMQYDGNFVIYPGDGGEPWATSTAGVPGLELRLQDDGYIVLYDAGQNVVWYAP